MNNSQLQFMYISARNVFVITRDLYNLSVHLKYVKFISSCHHYLLTINYATPESKSES